MTNVADEKNCQELIAFTVKEFGAVHVVVNSAGVLAAGIYFLFLFYFQVLWLLPKEFLIQKKL